MYWFPQRLKCSSDQWSVRWIVMAILSTLTEYEPCRPGLGRSLGHRTPCTTQHPRTPKTQNLIFMKSLNSQPLLSVLYLAFNKAFLSKSNSYQKSCCNCPKLDVWGHRSLFRCLLSDPGCPLCPPLHCPLPQSQAASRSGARRQWGGDCSLGCSAPVLLSCQQMGHYLTPAASDMGPPTWDTPVLPPIIIWF